MERHLAPARRAPSAALAGLLALALLAVPTAARAESERPPSAPDPRADALALAPSNDAFAAATLLDGGAGTTTGSTVDATREIGEPDHAATSAIRTVWYRWTAPGDGLVAFDTFGTRPNDDTVLAAYTGTDVTTLTLLDEDDDTEGQQSAIAFDADQGTTYAIAVAGYAGAPIPFRLSWKQAGTAPPNDDFADALALAGTSLRVHATTLDATREAAEPDHDAAGGTASTWYRYTAPTAGTLSIHDEQHDFDVVAALYTGSSVDDLTQVGASSTGELDVAVTGGTTYHLAVDGEAGASGDLALTLEVQPAAPANDDLDDAEVLDGASGTTSGQTLSATTEPDEPAHLGAPPARSVWYRWTAPTSGPHTFTVDGIDEDLYAAVAYTGSELADLEPVSGSSWPAALRVDAVAGTTYRIVVDGSDGDVFDLAWAPSTATFRDVSLVSPFWAEVEWMDDTGITTGYEDGTYRPSAPVTRQAMSAFLFRYASGFLDPVPNDDRFPDVSTTSPFFYEVEWMAQQEITTGYSDGTFRPSAPVTRQAMSAFLYRYRGDVFEPPAAPTFDDVSPGHPFYDAIEWMAANDISTGYEDGTFRPGDDISRQAMSAFLYRL